MLSGDCSAHAEQNADGGQDPEFSGLDWPTGAEYVRHADVEPNDGELRKRQKDDWEEEEAPATRNLCADVDVFPAPNHGHNHEDDAQKPEYDRHIQQMRVDAHCCVQHLINTLVEWQTATAFHQGFDRCDQIAQVSHGPSPCEENLYPRWVGNC
jgi:hypothetical protein